MAEVVTGEAVILEVPCARFPSRLLALVIDLVTQLVLLAILTGVSAAATFGPGSRASAAALLVTAFVLVAVGYPVIWETLSRGRSPGKLALGLRVVSDDGGPERFRQALVRGLAAAVEIWGLAGCPALICSLVSARGKRLGDVFAGTFVIQQRLPARQARAAPPPVPPQLAGWAAGLELSGLTDRLAETARRYLGRLPELHPAARDELGQRIAAEVSARVSPPPPPGTPAPAYLAAVLAERTRREQARLVPGAGPGGPAPAPVPGESAPAPVPGGPARAPGRTAPAPSGPAAVPGATAAAGGAAWEAEEKPPSRPGEAGDQPDDSAGGDGRSAPKAGGFAPPA
ncbi:MAG TPA: RDD family protein [Streptosporangiaceae bacterium]|nr:RDD family protein [Streptosporangiaceae bacterium]